MKNPTILEILFQTDAKEAATVLCAKWVQPEWVADCMARNYPHGMSPQGLLVLKGIAALLLLGFVTGLAIGIMKARHEIWPMQLTTTAGLPGGVPSGTVYYFKPNLLARIALHALGGLGWAAIVVLTIGTLATLLQVLVA